MLQAIYWVLPFILTLLMVALGPLIAPHHWRRYHPVWLISCAVSIAISLIMCCGPAESAHVLLGMVWHEYIPFIGLMFVLFVIASGIYIDIPGKSTPLKNTAVLAGATLFSSIIGTLGASLIFIRPFLKYNAWRLHKTHLALFFIFLVSNIGGVLTPLGDPPLFLGFLQGIDFFWTLKNLWLPFLTTALLLLIPFYIIDKYFYGKEQPLVLVKDHPWRLEGKSHLIFLMAVILVILSANFLTTDKVWGVCADIQIKRNACVRNFFLILIGISAWKTASPILLTQNRFSWAPLKETALIFGVIFITLIPVNILLEQGEHGVLAPLFQWSGIKHQQPLAYFWACGLLSGFLDNAPTYMIFFNIAGGQPDLLMTVQSTLLKAISLGAVFMGALTYIGNAPNLIVKEITQEYGVQMPNFLKYMQYSMGLIIVFIIISYLFL